MSDGTTSGRTHHVLVRALTALRAASASCVNLVFDGAGPSPTATALASLGVDANPSSFTFDGTSYCAAANSTISYRIEGESAEPGEDYPTDGDAVTVVESGG